MRKYAINGRIFEFPITGVGRFCVEVIKQLDVMFENGQCVLLVSNKARNIPKLRNIKTITVGNKVGIVWEQIELPLYLYKNRLVGINMSNSAPILKTDYIVIHDIQLKVLINEMNGINEKIRALWPLLNYKIHLKKAKHVFTVSEFQRKEICSHYHIDEKKITVVFNGWQHMEQIEEDKTIIDKYQLKPYEYYFAVSTRAKNKNFKWILDNARNNLNDTYVISGKVDTKYLTDDTAYSLNSNIITTGYVTDGELKALLKYSKAFIYPSVYEGFGIPPLEAISVGTRAIVANASCLPEIYEDSVLYIDPYNANVDLNILIENNHTDSKKILDKYSWENTAKIIFERIRYEM